MTPKKIILFLIILPYFSSQVNAQKFNDPIVECEVVFEEEDGIVAVEAEYFYKQSKSDIRQWYRTSKEEGAKVGRDEDGPHCKGAGNNAYLEILPDTRVTHGDKLTAGENFSNTAGEMGILHYKVKLNKPGRYYVWVRAYSCGAEDNGLHVGINGDWPETGQRLQWCEGKNAWRWESKQRTEKVHCGEPNLIYLDFEKAGVHEITFSMREDGFEFDRFLLSNEREYIPQEIGPDVKLASGTLPKPYPLVAQDPIAKQSFLYSVEKCVQGVRLLRATRFPVEGTDFYVNNEWLAINTDQHKKASTSTISNANDGTFDVLFLGVGTAENVGGVAAALSTLELSGAPSEPSEPSEPAKDWVVLLQKM